MVLLAAGLTTAHPGQAAPKDGDSLSQANRLLFRTPHLKGAPSPSTFTYRFSKSGSMGNHFKDVVRLRIRDDAKGQGKHVDIQLFTGDRKRPFPSTDQATGNPILKVFLQRDVLEMQDQTGGNWRHFQKYIKLALANSAQVDRTRFRYHGKQVDGWRIRIRPYENDPYRDRYAKFSDKQYVFLMSSKVPGQLYELRAQVPGPDGKKKPRLLETLRLENIKGSGGTR